MLQLFNTLSLQKKSNDINKRNKQLHTAQKGSVN